MATVFDIRCARPASRWDAVARARYNEERHSLPWFRWKNKKDEQTAPKSATTEVHEAPADRRSGGADAAEDGRDGDDGEA